MAAPRLCSISGCNKISRSRGWCSAHYHRWRDHGDPLAGGAARPAWPGRKADAICSVTGCGERYCARGWCHDHYYRWRRNGDPLGGQTAMREAFDYYRNVVLPYAGDECLLWPFATDQNGYGKVRIAGRLRRVSRAVCEEVNGPPPTSGHQAAHSCNTPRCCNSGHLSWKTQSENEDDKIANGTYWNRYGNT